MLHVHHLLLLLSMHLYTPKHARTHTLLCSYLLLCSYRNGRILFFYLINYPDFGVFTVVLSHECYNILIIYESPIPCLKKKKTMNPLLTWNLLYLIYLQILVQHIKAILPGLKSRISSALVSVAKEHASYGEITESKACLILSRDCVKLGWDHCSINWIFIACYEVVNFVLGITVDYKFVFYSSSVECWMSVLFLVIAWCS